MRIWLCILFAFICIAVLDGMMMGNPFSIIFTLISEPWTIILTSLFFGAMLELALSMNDKPASK